MNCRIGRIFKLLRQKIFLRIGGGDLFRFINRAFHSFQTRSKNQVGTECGQNPSPFDAHGFRHGQGEFVASGRRNIRQRNARITAGWFYYFHTRLEHPSFFGIPDHGGTDTALHGISGITPFNLGQNGRFRSLSYTIEFHQRCIADGLRIIRSIFFSLLPSILFFKRAACCISIGKYHVQVLASACSISAIISSICSIPIDRRIKSGVTPVASCSSADNC